MPFYIRARQQDIPTPTISTVASDDEDNFITDPEQFFDQLPQPFRLIDKVVNEIIESAWDKISSLEHERELEAKRVRPPTYTPSASVENRTNVSSICLTEGELIFLGLENSLVALKKDTEEEIASWQPEEEICVDQISSVYYAPAEFYLVTVVDDMGFTRLLIFETDIFHFVCTLNELVEGSPKSNAVKFEISKDSQFCGLVLETNKIATVDFYKLPIDNWVKEVDTGRKEYLKKTESLMTTSTSDTSADAEAHGSSSEIAFPPIKFSTIIPVLKVNEPTPVAGISGKTPQQMLDQVSSGDVIGDGTCHIFTENAISIQKKLFQVLNERDIMYAEEESFILTQKPTLHFLKKSCIEPQLQTKSDAEYTHAGIWWSNHQNFYIYQLTKSSKNIEFKADVVWPQSSYISCCAVADETMLLAIGLEKGSVTLWDRGMGLVKGVLMVSPNTPITDIGFLRPSTSPESTAYFHKEVGMLVGSENGQISHVVFGTEQTKKLIVPASQEKDGALVLIKPVPKLNEVFMTVSQNGKMVLRSTQQEGVICNLTLPEGYQLESPFHTGCALNSSGEILYLRGTSLSSNEASIFQFHLRSFPTLDKIRATQDDSEQNQDQTPAVKLNDVIRSLLSQRMRKQASRTETLAARWHNLDKQLDVVLNLKETMALARKEHHFSVSSTPASHWSRTTSRIIAHNKELQKTGSS